MLMARSYPRPAASRPLVHLPHIVHRERVIRSDQQPALGLRLGLLDLALLHYQSPVGERIAIVRCPVVPRLLRELAALLVVLVAPTRKTIASFLRPLLMERARPNDLPPGVDPIRNARIRHDGNLVVPELLQEYLHRRTLRSEERRPRVVR